MIPTLIMLAMVGQVSTQAIVEQSWKETLVVGHRGAAAYKPENTLASFEEAIRCKAMAAECDVHVSRDGQLMVMHDHTLDRTTSLKGAIKDFDAKTMTQAGVPTLEDYLQVTKDRTVSVIEIKGGDQVVQKTVALVQQLKMVKQTIVFSFSADFVREAKRIEPKLFTVWLNSAPANLEEHFAKCRDIKVDAIGIGYPAANEEIIKAAHDRKMPVFVWTVPPGSEVDRLKALKVNFIITNHPRDVIEQLKN